MSLQQQQQMSAGVKSENSSQQNSERKRRSYKACLHCRSRKAKCDLGDILAPSAPPCSRCKRESRECIFVPSRRGGNYVAKKRTASGSVVPSSSVGGRQDGLEEFSGDEGSDDPGPEKAVGKSRVEEGVFAVPDFRREGMGVTQQQQQHQGQAGFGYGGQQQQGGSNLGMGEGFSGMQQGSGISGYQHPPSTYDSRTGQQGAQAAFPQFQQPYQPTYHQQSQQQSQQHPPPASSQPTPQGYQSYAMSSSSSSQPMLTPQNHTQSITSPTSPLRYSNLQTLLLPSPGATQTSMSPSNDSGGPGSHSQSNERRSTSPGSKRRKLLGQDPTRSNHHHGATGEREKSNPKPTPQSIVAADMHNESDALAILALASREVEDGDGKNGEQARGGTQDQGGSGNERGRMGQGQGGQRMDVGVGMEGDMGAQDDVVDDLEWLGRFDLVRKGVMTEGDVVKLCEAFFRWHHLIFPMVPAHLIPNTPVEVALFSRDEGYLLTAIIIIASRHNVAEGMKDIHDKAWAVMRDHLMNVTCLGGVPTVGLVEGLLLLAENIPREPESLTNKRDSKEGAHGIENRQAWTLTGMAIRLAYGLGLDQIATQLESEGENTPELERARLAWTYCFLFDRHTSIRLGKGFWSRGPTRVMFRGYSNINQTGPAAAKANFPLLCMDANGVMRENSESSDLGSLVQAYVELTQRKMSNAHDVLYPSRARTHSLVAHGEYFKYMDDFNISLETFKAVWQTKQWHTFPLEDIVWCTFHYVRLYITAFSFQAHVERALIRAEAEAASQQQKFGEADQGLRPTENLFPKGGAASPDARYIYESIRAATEILEICVHSLHPGGALPYLPSRFTLFFQYSAVFLLKAVYSGAMVRADTVKTLQLIDRLCICMASSSQDKDHPAVRYAQMLRVLSRKLAMPAGSGATTGTGPSSPNSAAKKDLPDTTNGTAVNPTSQPSQAVPLAAPVGPVQANGQSQAPWQQAPALQPAPNPQASLSQWMPPYQMPIVGPSWANQPQPAAVSTFAAPNVSSLPFNGASSTAVGYNHLTNNGVIPFQQQYDQQQQIQQQDVAALYASMDPLFDDPVAEASGAGFDFDLADFWSKVGPGEAQGGFPFR